MGAKDIEKNLIDKGYIESLLIRDTGVIIKTNKDKLLASAMVRQELNDRFNLTGYPISIKVLN